MGLITSKIQKLIESARQYIDIRVTQITLEVADRLATFLSDTLAIIILVLFLVMFVVFSSVGLSLLLNKVLSSVYVGFFIVGGSWLLTGVVLYAARKRIFERKLKNVIIRRLFNNNDSENV